MGPGAGALRLSSNSKKLTCLNGLHPVKTLLNKRQEIRESIGTSMQDQNCDPTAGEVLCVFDAAVHGDQDLKSLTFRERR